MTIKEHLGKQLLFADGAMGTQLQARGLPLGTAPMLWNMTHPDTVQEVHTAYLDAGASYITTNTFCTNTLTLAHEPYTVDEVITAGVRIAHAAKEHRQSEAFVVLGLGPMGTLLKPLGALTFDEAYSFYSEQIKAGVAAGVDALLFETMIDTYELKACVLAAKELCELPVIATVAINEQGRLLNGADLRSVCVLLEGLGVDALGLNCGAGPLEICTYAQELQTLSSLPLVVCPNAGMPVMKEGKAHYTTTPEEFALHMKSIVNQNIAVVGGCCGTTPSHIQALVNAYRTTYVTPPVTRRGRFVSSSTVSLDRETSAPVVDKRIDPSTNAELAEALIRGDYEYAVDEALDAVIKGAQILRVSAAYPGIDEVKALPTLVEFLQEVIKVPLCISGSDIRALERALRIYNGCPLLDMRSLTPDTVERARALALHYGALLEDSEER